MNLYANEIKAKYEKRGKYLPHYTKLQSDNHFITSTKTYFLIGTVRVTLKLT